MWIRDIAEHLRRHSRELAVTFLFQSSLQGLAMATGLLIVHAISKEDYGLYAIVTSLQGMAAVLSDSGIGSTVHSLLGRIWEDRKATHGVMATALKERQRLLAGALPICAAMMLFLVIGKTSIANLLVMELAMICCVYFEVGTFLYQMVPLYTGKRRELQTLQVALGSVRIIAIVAFVLVYHINLVALLCINVAWNCINFFLSRRMIVGTVKLKPNPDPEMSREMRRNILRLLPTVVFFAFQAQITTYIISLFGNLADVAAVAALGRIGLLFGVLLNVASLLGGPAFSKARNKTEGMRIFWLVTGSVALFGLVLFGMSLWIPGLMLEILGKNYASLTVELQITVISTGLYCLAGAIWGMLTSRGLVGMGWIYIVVTIVIQFVYAAFGDIRTVQGVLWFGVATSGANLLNVAIQAYWLILRPKELGRNR